MIDITTHRNQILTILSETNNHYPTSQIELSVGDRSIKYHRWMHPWQGSWEVESLFTQDMLNNLAKIITKGSTVIDIGAHTGNMSVAYSQFAQTVLSFEPNPATYEVLEKNAQLNPNIKPYNYAISDEEGPLTFHYSDYGFCNGGFATRTDFGIGVTGHKIPIDVWGINLENFIKQNNIQLDNISLIKIDAEGHDKDILKTLNNLISVHRPVIITEIYDGLSVSETTDLLNTIQSMGYKAYDEKSNQLNIDNLGSEIKSAKDIQPGSGHNLICIYGS